MTFPISTSSACLSAVTLRYAHQYQGGAGGELHATHHFQHAEAFFIDLIAAQHHFVGATGQGQAVGGTVAVENQYNVLPGVAAGVVFQLVGDDAGVGVGQEFQVPLNEFGGGQSEGGVRGAGQ